MIKSYKEAKVGDKVIYAQLSNRYPEQNQTLNKHLRMGDRYTISYILAGDIRMFELLEIGKDVDFVEDAFMVVGQLGDDNE